MDKITFQAIPSDRLAGKLRNYHIYITLFFYLCILSIISLTIYGFLHPGTVFHLAFYYHLYFAAFFTYFFYKPPLPHNYKKDDSNELSYIFDEDALVIMFYGKKQLVIPYNTIISVESLPQKLKGIKGIHAVSRHYWTTFGEVAGSSIDYPTLFVFSTCLSKGLLLGRKYEKILISPEMEDEFIRELGKRSVMFKSAEG